jgi:hypothetical protein
MAQYTLTAALNASTFPFVTRFQPRSVIIGTMDGRLRDPTSNPQNFLDNNPQNIPQVLYCENVLPSTEGIRSVAFSNVQAAFPGAGVPDDVLILRTDTDTWYFSPSQGMNYVTPALGTPWVSTNPLAGAPIAVEYKVSAAYVGGFTFICYWKPGTSTGIILKWDGATFTDITATFLGVTGSTIKAICNSGNYLIALSGTAIKWSSLTNPIDFTIVAGSGAGSQIPIDVRGVAIALTQISGGFLIHCTENTVASVYTQNAAAPWIFREVRNSGGLLSWNYLARDTSAGVAYIFSSYGMQQQTLKEAENLHPILTEFISSKILETFDSTTNLLSISRVAGIYIKVAFLGGRFLCVSYGTTAAAGPFNYVLIYDITLRRWGKLKVDHYDMFQSAETSPILVSPFDALFVLKTDGSVDQLVIDERIISTTTSVVILGRYQLSRGNQLCSQELELEVLDSNQAPTVHVVTNYNGTTLGQAIQMTLYESSDNYRHYQKQIEGENLSYIIKGQFNLATAILTFSKGGRM